MIEIKRKIQFYSLYHSKKKEEWLKSWAKSNCLIFNDSKKEYISPDGHTEIQADAKIFSFEEAYEILSKKNVGIWSFHFIK